MLFGIAPTAEAFGAPPSKSIMFGIDWIPYRIARSLVLVDVHLDELEVVFLGDALEHGLDRVTRPAPLGPEVHEDRLVRLQDLGLEGGVGDVRCHRFLSVFRVIGEGFYPAFQR
jgi:hypothetical protein